jgi:hypothetical protein
MQMKKRLYLVPVLCLFVFALSSSGIQSQSTQPAAPSTAPQANSTDVDSVEHIMTAVYDAISGPAGGRNWDRLRSLFYAGARLIPTRNDDKGKATANPLTIDEYIERVKPFFEKEGFYENAVSNRVETWDRIAHVWSTYESHHAKGDKPFARGINSFQLFNDGSRWWVMTIYWEGENKDHAIPEKYLHQ